MKLAYCLFVCTGLLLLFYGLSQTPGVYPAEVSTQYRRANDYYEKAIKYSYDDNKEAKFNQLALEEFKSLSHHLPGTKSKSDTIRFHSYVKMGELESYFDSTGTALYYYQQALALRPTLSHLPDSAYFKPYLFAGIIYYQQSQPDSAVNYFKKAEAIQSGYQNELQESERLYNMLGAIYYESGNYYQARNYFLKATEVLPKNHPFYTGLFVNYNINLATVLFKLEAYDTSRKIFQKLLPYHVYQNEIYNNLGLLNLYSNAPQKAIQYFERVTYTNFLQIGLYNDIATAYKNLGNYATAGKYLDLAIARNPIFYKTRNKDLGQSFKLAGDLHKHLKKYTEALAYYQRALNQLYPAFKDSSINSVPLSFSGVFSYIELFNTLVAKAEVWHLLYTDSGDIKEADEELATYQSAFNLLGYIGKTYDSDQARLFLGKIKYLIHSKPVEIAYEMYSKTRNRKYLDHLYYFDQQNKASILAFNQEFSALAQQTNLPLLTTIGNLRRKITALSIKVNETTDSSQLVTTDVSIRNLEIELGKKQELLAKQLPLSSTTTQPLKELQDHVLDDQTEVISYTLSAEKLTTIAITKETITSYQHTLPPGFTEQLRAYIASLTFPSDSFSRSISQSLNSVLMGGIDERKIHHLIIIPDNELCYLPFETLVDNKGSYLLENYSIQYQYSTSVLKKSVSTLKGYETTAFAPFASSGSNGFEQLPNSLSEIKNLAGEKFVDSSATKDNFLRHLQDHRVLHLATHAIANNEQDNFSYILFAGKDTNKSRLYSSEIYNLPLQSTDLVILSACETGSGNLTKGEGIMSLSRAFRYAGCPNVVMTLWKADDYSTAYLTDHMHQYLGRGLTIDEALQKAKLNYLQDRKINPRLKQPHYWSQLVFVGNLSERKSAPWPWIVISIAIIFSLLTLLVIRKSRSRRDHLS
jgi:CHAT domain-containing protein/Tfp pilus assembly protein PilF